MFSLHILAAVQRLHALEPNRVSEAPCFALQMNLQALQVHQP